MASTPAAEPDTRTMKTRVTKGGRKLTYVLNVIQQPKQARACGQGAKSSTDRRPVDPPPMVDFRILEGEEGNQQDITFSYHANFQLYVTLEHARTISQGRVPPTSGNQLVLAGQTVTGMNYLERPQPGGYFIYSDLSVRHEGKYRLSFQLYEETKDPMDVDADEAAPDASAGTGKHLTGRFEVKSVPFIVYSAKKFPGLMESTQLSRTIADQGCRVRIRRDVRMRRRDQLNNLKDDNWDEYDDDAAEQRETADGPSAEPAPPANNDAYERPRSQSIAPAPVQPQRRMSSHDMGQQYHTNYMQPPTQQYGPQSVSSQSPYETTPISPYPPAPQYIPQQQQHLQQQQQSHYQHPQYPYQTQGMPTMPQASQYMPMQSPIYEQHYAQNMYNSHQSMTSHYGYPQQYSMHPIYGPVPLPPHQQMYYNQNQSMPMSATSTALPPLKILDQAKPKSDVPSPSMLNHTDMARYPPPPLPYAGYINSAPIPQPPSQYLSGANSSTAAKRSFGSVFDSQHINTPMRSGGRPTSSPVGIGIVSIEEASDEEPYDLEQLKMRYRRADGTEISRRWPPLR